MKEFADLHSPAAYSPLGPGDDGPLGKIWALVASDWHVREPAYIFQKGRFFVVEAAPPGPTLRRWTRKHRCEDFYIRPWSFSEVLQAYANLQLEIRNTYVSTVAHSSDVTSQVRSNCGTCTTHMVHLSGACSYSPNSRVTTIVGLRPRSIGYRPQD